jgi:hypothetical protein
MPLAGFELAIPVFGRSKTVLAFRPHSQWDRHVDDDDDDMYQYYHLVKELD